MSARDFKLVGIIPFVFVIVAGAVLQILVLPMTPWHVGSGLMSGGDWVSFHRLAVELAENVRQYGWSSWVLRVQGQAPASVLALLYAWTGIQQPWVLLPLHGVLYSISSMALYCMVRDLGGTSRQAWIMLLPMFLFPSTAMIWGQIHKDIYSLAGILLVLRFWLRVWMMFSRNENTLFNAWGEILLLMVGMLLIKLVRPYLADVTFLASIVVATVLTLGIFIRSNVKRVALSAIGPSVMSFRSAVITAALGLVVQTSVVVFERAKGVDVICPRWTPTMYLPTLLDNQLSSLGCARNAFITSYPEAGSNIDVDVQFSSAGDVVMYLPRALQISLFAPFPSQWFADAVQPGGRMMRLLVIPEMLVLYAAQLGILAGLARSECRLPFAILLIFSLIIVVVHALVVTNVGTLYRMRFPSMLVWIQLGLLGWISFRSMCRQKHL